MADTDLDALARRQASLITRREAVKRVSILLGGVTLIGGSALLTGCRDDTAGDGADSAGVAGGEFTAEEIALLDEIADTILPATSSPGAKAAQTGAFMALMVKDTYTADDQRTFRDGLRTVNEASERMHQVAFMQATPEQRTALLEQLDREQHQYMRDRQAAQARGAAPPPVAAAADTGDTASRSPAGERADARLPDQRSEGTVDGDANPAVAITADAPPHYFRMMKELALLGYFTSEIGYTQHMRYRETPGRFDPCADYTPGEKIWAPHA